MVANPQQTKILVLDGHSKASAEVVLALPKSCVIHAAATSQDSLSFASRRLAQRLKQPDSVDELRLWLEAMDEVNCYDLIVASTESSLLALKSQSFSPALRAKAVIPPESSIDIALSKQQTLSVAQCLGIKVPQSVVVNTIEQLSAPASYPLVVKPLHSKVIVNGKVRTFAASICANETERRFAYHKMLEYTPIVEQEYFRGRGIGVETLFDKGKLVWLFAHERIHEFPLTGGASTYRRSVRVSAPVRQAAVALLEHLQWHGVAMVEFKVADDGDYRLIEINPRLWGSLPLAVASGVNFPLGLLHLALGVPVGEKSCYRNNLYMRDLVADMRWYVHSWRHRKNPLLVKPLNMTDIYCISRPFFGNERWDLFRWKEPELWWELSKASSGFLAKFERNIQRIRSSYSSRRNWKNIGKLLRSGQVKRVLVLCYGNICRSPVVERLLRNSVDGIEVISAGFHPQGQRSVPAVWASVVAQTLGVDLNSHQSQVVDDAKLQWADLIVVMDTANWATLGRQFPMSLPKTILLGGIKSPSAFMVPEIPDPYGLDEGKAKEIAQFLDNSVKKFSKLLRRER